jgi:hypothetical protein
MPITEQQARRLRVLISDYGTDLVANSWKGSGDPADVPLIEQDLAYSKRKLEEFIHELEGKPAVPPLENP